MARVRFGVVVALAAVALAGCSTTSPGQAEPTTTASTSGSAGGNLSRPKDLNIANVDPCALLTDAQMAQMSIVRKAPGSGSPEGGSPSSCSYTVTAPTTFLLNVSLESKRGVESWLDGTYAGQDVRQLQVLSFSAAQTLLVGEKFTDPNASSCETLVSTSAGHEMNALASQTDTGLSTTQLCDLSKQLATLALTTLQANQ